MTKLLKVAWVTFPLGVAITIAASIFVLWWQNLSYSDTYAQAILIHGTLLSLSILWSYFFRLQSWNIEVSALWSLTSVCKIVAGLVSSFFRINLRTNQLKWQDLRVYWS